jgi:hypothetical protein
MLLALILYHNRVIKIIFIQLIKTKSNETTTTSFRHSNLDIDRL